MIIRKAEQKDIKQCVILSKIPEFKMPNGDLPNAKYFEDSLNQIFFVAEENNTVIGLILGYKLTTEDVYLDLIVIDSQHRGKKTGQQLLQAFRNELKNQGLKQYFLIAPSFNQKTINFYRKQGLIEGKQYTLFCENI